MIQRRSDAAACAMGGKMYVAGGYTGETVLQTVEMYIPEVDIWTEVAHMSSPRSGKHALQEKFLFVKQNLSLRIKICKLLNLASYGYSKNLSFAEVLD